MVSGGEAACTHIHSHSVQKQRIAEEDCWSQEITLVFSPGDVSSLLGGVAVAATAVALAGTAEAFVAIVAPAAAIVVVTFLLSLSIYLAFVRR